MISPGDHFCDVGDLRFERIDGGHVWCQQCHRVWERQRTNGAWSVYPHAYGDWRTLPGNRFAHRLTGEIVEGPPLPSAGAERWGPEKANRPELTLRPAQKVVSRTRSDVGNDTPV